jgi:hypothetical protein
MEVTYFSERLACSQNNPRSNNPKTIIFFHIAVIIVQYKAVFILFIYLFILDLFQDTVSISNYRPKAVMHNRCSSAHRCAAEAI